MFLCGKKTNKVSAAATPTLKVVLTGSYKSSNLISGISIEFMFLRLLAFVCIMACLIAIIYALKAYRDTRHLKEKEEEKDF